MYFSLGNFFLALIGLVRLIGTNGLGFDKFVFNYLFDPMGYLSNDDTTTQSDFNIDLVKKMIIDEMNIQKKQIKQEKYKTVLEKEAKLKEELYKIAKSNIIKQLEIEKENKKLEDYYKLMKKNFRKSIDDDDDELLIKIVEEKLNQKNN